MTYDVNMRQKVVSQLSWIALTHGVPNTAVQITAVNIPGDYNLELESFDDNTAAKITIVTDLITIRVLAQQYIRDTALPSSFEIVQNDQKSLSLENIRPVLPTTVTYDI